jgi:hypothetical protein
MRKRSLQRLVLCCISYALLFSVSMVASQAQKINRNRPSVFLTFKEFVKETADEASPSKGARLVLHNNTRWPIYYRAWLDRTLPGDVAMCYVIEQENGSRALRGHVEVVTTTKLSPGKSVSFTVPQEDFLMNSLIYVSFNFSWEYVKEKRIPYEVDHRVYFHSADLPPWPK